MLPVQIVEKEGLKLLSKSLIHDTSFLLENTCPKKPFQIYKKISKITNWHSRLFCSHSHDEFTAKHGYFRCSRPPDVDEIKIFDKDNQATKHVLFIYLNVLWPGYRWSHNIRRLWTPEITMFCSELIITKTFKPIKTRRYWPPIWIHNFFNKACFSSWPLFFIHLGCFWLDFTVFASSELRLDSSMTSYSKTPF